MRLRCVRCGRRIRPHEIRRRTSSGRLRHGSCPRRRLKRGHRGRVPARSPFFMSQGQSFLPSPALRLLIGMGQLLCNYVVETLGPHLPLEGAGGELTDELRAEIQAEIEAEIGKAPHPEALDPLLTPVDERQEGRSEVVREIANPRQS